MPTAQEQIESRIRSFVQELNALVRAAAIDAVRAALGTGASPARRGPGRPQKSAPASRVARAPKPSGGGQRSPALLAKTVDALRAHVLQHPGQRIEQIAPALGVTTKDLALPTKKLLAAKAISRQGAKRFTTYWPGAKK